MELEGPTPILNISNTLICSIYSLNFTNINFMIHIITFLISINNPHIKYPLITKG